MTSPTPAPQRILLTGSNGQIGTVLAAELRATYGAANVVCSDIAHHGQRMNPRLKNLGLIHIEAFADGFFVVRVAQNRIGARPQTKGSAEQIP